MVNTKAILLMALMSGLANAEEIKTLVEFYSFNCIHCANVNTKLDSYLALHNIKYLGVNIDTSKAAAASSLMYYLAQEAKVGSQFKSAYFSAVAKGMPAYTADTLKYVVQQVQNPQLLKLIADETAKERAQQKLAYANSLIAQYHIQATPSFLINQTTLLEGEDVINQLQGSV